jgi:CTP:molybdopterin cytidylyltransferase MocA
MTSKAPLGLVLCAGLSKRLGSAKALVEVGGVPLVVWACRHLLDAGCAEVVVVTNEQLRSNLGALPNGVQVVTNPEPENGRTGSLQVGLNHLRSRFPSLKRVVMAPVDRPGWRAGVVRTLVAKTGSSCPVFEGRRGHPVVLDNEVLQIVLDAHPNTPLRDLVDFQAVEVDAPWLGLNVDTPEQLAELRRNEGNLLAYFTQGEGI